MPMSSLVQQRGRRRFLVVLVALLWGMALPAAGTDPYSGDPLGIIAYPEESSRFYAQGVDDWEVWICEYPNGVVALQAAEVVNLLNSQITPFFRWLSQGRYHPAFRVGGTVRSSTDYPPDVRALDCEGKVARGTAGTAEAVLIVTTGDGNGGYGSPGIPCGILTGGCPTTYPSNQRFAVVSAGTVTALPPLAEPRLSTVAHEVGHALSWPHSYGGLVRSGGAVFEYDNPMDVMSAARQVGLDRGTLAVNLYAAGWLDPGVVAFHRGGTLTYRVGPAGSDAVNLLVFPRDDGPGVFEFLGARVRVGYDTGIPAEGLDLYRVDQRPTACPAPVASACIGLDRRTQPLPAVESIDSVAHVYAPGQVVDLRGVRVEVLSREGQVFTVRVSGAAVAERFVDDNGNPHEADIAAIAELSITLGCNPPLNDRYCPQRSVTRAEVAAFLLRALGHPVDPAAAHVGYFSDVPADAWYAPFVEELYELGITAGYGDGTFRPNQALSRAEMAALILRAFGFDPSAQAAAGVFSDVPVDAWFAPSVEMLHAVGITAGCSTDPLAYCPYGAVLREQMASFLFRAVNLR